tara:strand:+ start:236 stop:412 length:177 start_codon:yes stop_codon:yes gene_type:complete
MINPQEQTKTEYVTLPGRIMEVEVPLAEKVNYGSTNKSTPPQSSLCPSQLENSADSGE